jgi:hypothetical protein
VACQANSAAHTAAEKNGIDGKTFHPHYEAKRFTPVYPAKQKARD